VYAGHFDFSQPLVWTVPEVLTAEECRALIDRAESGEWLAATINTAEGREVATHVRNNLTAIIDDEALALRIYDRIRDSIPDPLMGQRPAGIKPRWRVYRYDMGHHFGLHGDQSYLGPNGTRSLLTLLVYLNRGYEGGETDFPEIGERVHAEIGKALLFQHMVLHEGATVTAGRKYVLRSDVLFSTGPLEE
jgi:prolyl 4-hydroxylase